MRIYHGSKAIIENPICKGSEQHNDYGPAFYLTTDLEMAKMWACRNDESGIVNVYILRIDSFKKLKILNLTDKNKYSVLNWLAILMHFRKLDSAFVKRNKEVLDWLNKYYLDVDQYDVIIGYRADDAYFRFPIRFISNDLAFEDLEDAFLSGNLGVQYAFISSKAIELLKFEDAIICDETFRGKYYQIIQKATMAFDESLNKPRDINKTYILDMMRKENE